MNSQKALPGFAEPNLNSPHQAKRSSSRCGAILAAYDADGNGLKNTFNWKGRWGGAIVASLLQAADPDLARGCDPEIAGMYDFLSYLLAHDAVTSSCPAELIQGWFRNETA